MWVVVIGVIVLTIVIALIREALGYDRPTMSGLSIQEYKQERDELTNHWFSGNRLPGDEKRMFEEFYEGDVDAPEWD